MKTAPLWQISITCAREADEAVAALLERLFGKGASIFSPEDQPVSVATVYSSQKRERVLAKREALDAGLKFLSGCDLNLGPAKVAIRKVRREDWSTSWRKFFKTLKFGSALLIRPTWSQSRAQPGQAVVTLDPGLSFGTGQHPTTGFCLKQLVQLRKSGQAQSFLDIGTGSGILAIAAVKLGYAPVIALDNDPVAVRVAKANARKNRVHHKLVIKRQDLTNLPLESPVDYDLIGANLIMDLLVSGRQRILNRLSMEGTLVLSGILTRQFAEVQRVYERGGLRMQVFQTEGEWTSGAFTAVGRSALAGFGQSGR
jgi:ribosomal protein L11 methyltransferase